MTGALAGRRIVVPESRELDLFVSMLERVGAEAIRCPLVSILDVIDPAPAEAWLRRLAGGGHDDLVLYTGEGLRRLLGIAGRAGMEADVIAALARVRTIVRGPKPARVLRENGLAPGVAAEEPTTAGLVAALSTLDLAGRRVAIQLYPDGPDDVAEHVRRAGGEPDAILPYRYASHEDGDRVVAVLDRMAAGEVDAIALTSRPQVKRLVDLARERGMEAVLARACAVGPVCAEAARAAGWTVGLMPDGNFHLKPFVNEMAAVLSGRRAA